MSKLQKIIGFDQFLLFPSAAFTLSILGYVVGTPIPVQVLVGVYPLGQLLLAIYPSLAFRYRTRAILKDYLEFARGAWYASITVAIFSMVHFLVVPFYLDTSVGWGFLFVSVGSIWFPQAAAAGAYAVLSADREASEDFLKRISERRAFERAAAVFLALFVRKSQYLRQDFQAAFVALSLLVLVVYGWVLLSVAGGSPVTLFGMGMATLIPLLSYKYSRTSPDHVRETVSQLLAKASSTQA